MSGVEKVLELHQHGQIVFRLFPGEAVTAGRSGDADWILKDGSISRAHARLEWLLGASPQVLDLGSQNGTFVGGERLKGGAIGPLEDGMTLSLGVLDFKVKVGALAFTPALLLESNGEREGLPPPAGRFRGWQEIKRFFLRLERDRSTGSLLLDRPTGSRRVTIFLGSLVLDPVAGMALLRTLSSAPASVRYSFADELEIGTQPIEGCLPSELIETWENQDGLHSTHRFVRPPEAFDDGFDDDC